jgi:hypothetical protein
MNKKILFLGFILIPFISLSQDFVDALRYSSAKIEGTARSGGMGNAFGALGGDFTAVGINPAGLGIYRSSEFALTPYFGMTNAAASYIGTSVEEDHYVGGLNNLSYVATFKTNVKNGTGLININFGVGFNRLKDFNSYSLAEGHNANASFLDYITENANFDDWSDFYEELAWQTDVLLYDTVSKVYWHDIQDAGYGQSQQKSYQRSGSLDEYTLAVGLNFSHKFYLGFSLGLLDLYFKEFTTLKEWDPDNSIPYLNNYSFNSSLNTVGTGFNCKIGVIYKPTQEIRLGASLATPNFYDLNDLFETSMKSSITYSDKSTKAWDADSPLMDYDYELVSPFKATLSGAFVLGKRALVSADIEYLDYSIAKFRNGGDGYDFIDQNKDIADIYKSVTNFRLGGEFRISDPLAVRAGFELYPSAFNSEAFGVPQPNAEEKLTVYSAGIGYKGERFFFDAAYRLSSFGEYNMLYPAPMTNDFPEPAMAKFDNKNSKVLFTLGFRF